MVGLRPAEAGERDMVGLRPAEAGERDVVGLHPAVYIKKFSGSWHKYLNFTHLIYLKLTLTRATLHSKIKCSPYRDTYSF